MWFSLHIYTPERVAQRREIGSFFIQEVDRDKIVLFGEHVPGSGYLPRVGHQPSGAALPGLPGEELVRAGLEDLGRGVESIESLLVSIGAPRLTALGFLIPRPFPAPERRLYELLQRDDPDAAHSRYNALVRRLVSFERAAECAS